MTLDEAMNLARLIGEMPRDGLSLTDETAQVLAAEVTRLREQVAHLERLALRSRSAGAGR